MPAGHLEITVYPEWWLHIICVHLQRLQDRGWVRPAWAERAVAAMFHAGLRLRASEHTSRYNRRKEVL